MSKIQPSVHKMHSLNQRLNSSAISSRSNNLYGSKKTTEPVKICMNEADVI